jgi:hypothetical protein
MQAEQAGTATTCPGGEGAAADAGRSQEGRIGAGGAVRAAVTGLGLVLQDAKGLKEGQHNNNGGAGR